MSCSTFYFCRLLYFLHPADALFVFLICSAAKSEKKSQPPITLCSLLDKHVLFPCCVFVQPGATTAPLCSQLGGVFWLKVVQWEIWDFSVDLVSRCYIKIPVCVVGNCVTGAAAGVCECVCLVTRIVVGVWVKSEQVDRMLNNFNFSTYLHKPHDVSDQGHQRSWCCGQCWFKERVWFLCVCLCFFNVKVNCACVTGSLLFMTKNSTLTKNTLTVIYIKGVLNIFW